MLCASYVGNLSKAKSIWAGTSVTTELTQRHTLAKYVGNRLAQRCAFMHTSKRIRLSIVIARRVERRLRRANR